MGMSFFWSTSVHRNDKVGGMRFHLLVIQHTDHIFLCVIGIYPITDSVLNFQISLMLPVCGTGQHPTNDNANFDVNYGADGRSYTLLGPNIMRVFPVHMHSVCRKFGCLSRTHLPSFINVYETHISGLDLEPCHVRDEAGEVFRTKATGKMIVKAT